MCCATDARRHQVGLAARQPLAQAKPDQKALAKFITLGNPDDEALADHRLTVENVRQMFAVERELLKLLKEVPDLETRIGELRIGL